ncbi:unnamed protein product [Prorocentrum cordatum]|uniref:Uncharacterized protein n=1 Tax=Prorocentrum cordatum TaxID=2364126 RepID=A0ABN9X7M5_9DINO|nr:unnamed protein product [Polarella glacialis]
MSTPLWRSTGAAGFAHRRGFQLHGRSRRGPVLHDGEIRTQVHVADTQGSEIANRLCSEGLWEWFEEYQQTHGLSPQDPTFWKAEGATVNYVGYAGMGDLDFFRSERVRSLAQALNEDGRIYLNRWSDQTYYVLLFALFENHSAVGDIGFRWPESAWCHKCSLNETKLG